MEEGELVRWINRGNQRRAVARSLETVMTMTQICEAAARDTPQITLRDTRAIVRDFEDRDLVRCLNPEARNGRLYAPTAQARQVFAQASPKYCPGPDGLPAGCNHETMSYLLRGRVRTEVFRRLADDDPFRPRYDSATLVKRAMREQYPVTLNQSIRALHELRRSGLIMRVDSDGVQRRYMLTEQGQHVARWMRRG